MTQRNTTRAGLFGLAVTATLLTIILSIGSCQQTAIVCSEEELGQQYQRFVEPFVSGTVAQNIRFIDAFLSCKTTAER